MHFGNCFCKPHNDVVWPNQHLNPFQIGLCLKPVWFKIGLCLAKPSLCGYKQHFPKRFQRGVYTAAIWNRLCKWAFRGTYCALSSWNVITSNSPRMYRMGGWVFLTVSFPDRDIFVLAQGKSWHSCYQEIGTHARNRSTSVYTSFFFDRSMQCTDQWVTMA